MVRIVTTNTNTYLTVFNQNGEIENQQIFVIGASGTGKGIACESIAETLQKNNYTILIIADPKCEIEYGYAMFEPKEKYHLDRLKIEGRHPESKKVKLYHPFTFRLPRTKLPDINFYTFSLKDLGRESWGFLAETDSETDSVSLLINASDNIPNNIGIKGLVHYIEDLVKGKRSGKKIIRDPKNWYISSTGGTMKSLPDILKFLKYFEKDYFLSRDDCPYKLNMKEIINDNEHYHVFFSNFIKDDKIKEFTVLTLLDQIILNKEYAKHPICIIIPEIKKLVPYKPEGYKRFLAKSIMKDLGTIRSMGKGMSSVLDTQVFSDVDESVMNSSTVTLIGQLGGIKDIEKISKALNYKREIREQLSKMEKRNTFFLKGEEETGAIRITFPRHCHAEPKYNFFDMYAKEFPEKMKKYGDLINEFQKMHDEDINKIKDKIKKQEKEEQVTLDQFKKEKEQSKKETKKVDEKIEKAKEIQNKSKEVIMKLCYEEKQNNPKLSYRDLAKKFGVTHHTAKDYVTKYQELLYKENSKSDYEKIVDEVLNSPPS